jgi:hypothetical protein
MVCVGFNFLKYYEATVAAVLDRFVPEYAVLDDFLTRNQIFLKIWKPTRFMDCQV